MCALPVLSACLPNVTGKYDGDRVGPNLYLFVVAAFGAGKGGARYAKKLGEKIHRAKRDCTAEERSEQETPKKNMLFIPANSSRTGAIELLADNDGKGIVFETEADTLTETVAQDYGNYSDALRAAYHHETISFFRRQNKEYIEIEKPQLSVVLTGTPDQLQRLIPTPENGLFSRFMFFKLECSTEFKDVFDNRKNRYEKDFDALADNIKKLYDKLEAKDGGITFVLTSDQKDKFIKHFGKLKKEVNEYVSSDMNGVVNRLGLMAYRIAIILSVVRREADLPEEVLICQDVDFDNALRIIGISYSCALEIYQNFPKRQLPSKNQFAEKAKDINRCIELFQQGKSYKEIAIEVFKSESKKSQAYYYINGRK